MIRFEQVSVTYEGAAHPSLRDADFTVPEGELTLLVGPSGVGKSTLLGAVSGLVPHFTGGTLRGRVTVAGRDTRTHMPRELADVVGTVGQDPLAHFVTDVVEDELAYGMESLGLAPAVMRRRVEETLDLLGLNELRDRPIASLSGGQQQRVAIGSVLTPHPRVLVLDEPTSALDPAAAEEVLAVLQRLVHDLGTTVLMAEHRLERVVQYADQVLLLPAPGAAPVLGPPAEIMAVSPVHPPVVSLGRLAGWSPLPLSIRDARRQSAPLRTHLSARGAAATPAAPAPGSAPTPGAPAPGAAAPTTPAPGSAATPGAPAPGAAAPTTPAPGSAATPGLSGLGSAAPAPDVAAPGSAPDPALGVPGPASASPDPGTGLSMPGAAAARGESPTRPSTVPQGSAPDPAPQSPARLDLPSGQPGPQADHPGGRQPPGPHPAPPAIEARGSGGGAPSFGKGRGGEEAPRSGTGTGWLGRVLQRGTSPGPRSGTGSDNRPGSGGRLGRRRTGTAPDQGSGSGTGGGRSGASPGLAARLRRRGGQAAAPAGSTAPGQGSGGGPGQDSTPGQGSGSVAAATALGIRRGRAEVLRDVTLRVAPGETVALMGRNGAGKSTLLAALTGTLAPTTGQVTVGGRTPHRTPPPEMVRRVGLVPQEPRDLLYADTVAAECAAADADAGAAAGTCRALVGALLPGVPDDTHPRDLSEGQRLTLALALVLTGRPALLLLDEPTRGLDYAAKARLVETLRALAADGHAIVLATHDVELAAELAHRVVILAGGEIVADGPTAEVVVSSPAFAPQVAKILAPGHWLTVSQVAAALEATT
ncbi:ABC transporter ATP-binding protein [Streptomyces sp. NBC_00091]|uniref:ABC transporter ATP-binding protein n=1 Tax=Streptomyces sp. NBC_00091 TaxID=2975648 RepID=UPI002259977C|nr:ABC transporter ATP-binding protein [Streptomyces sp. NBC_00091]MCX5378572.1 ABC transporter ATP-binding protein [Streptomyces sp. NBC_00091]